ncbi:hypothetical protein I3760_03G150200 [Carya illinoinensis]|nr:hypothetical protein I3760_03G150200 [Carya illinoinensis]
MESEAQEPNPNSNNNNEGLVTAFCEITSSSREEALFFLESHNFDLDAAVSTFLDDPTNNEEDVVHANAETDAVVTHPTVPPRSPSPQSEPESPDYSPSRSRSRSRSASPKPSRAPYELRSKRGKKKHKKNNRPSRSRSTTRGNVRTLADLNRPAPDEFDISDDSDEPQEYYTGGEKSGMLVQDPTKPKGNDVDTIFNRARQVAIEEPADHLRPSSSSKSFTGTARLLSGGTVSSALQPPEVVNHTITFWSNGFSVDNGPLRRFDDPANASFLESIKESECPEELEAPDSRTAVHVDLEKRDENYPEPAKPAKHRIPFRGVGRTLGDTATTPATSEPTVADTSSNITQLPSMGLVVDESLPSTSIQLRLADGTRIVSRFNLHHTIRDIHDFIDASRPGGVGTYQLLTMGFPPKQLADLDQIIDQAGIANSVVIQKF